MVTLPKKTRVQINNYRRAKIEFLWVPSIVSSTSASRPTRSQIFSHPNFILSQWWAVVVVQSTAWLAHKHKFVGSILATIVRFQRTLYQPT